MSTLPKFRIAITLAFGGVACLSGCGVDMAGLASTMQEMQAKHGANSSLPEISAMSESLLGNDAEFLTAGDGEFATDQSKSQAEVYAPPYPERSNPFEFGIDVSASSNTVADEGKREMTLYGFVGDQDTRAIIHLGGQTRIMSVGDRWGKLELIEIAPPEVRTRTDGLIRTWSLLGRSDSTNE